MRLRIKPDGEAIEDQARDGRVSVDGGLLDFLRLVEPALAAIGGERADEGCLAPAGAGRQHETV